MRLQSLIAGIGLLVWVGIAAPAHADQPAVAWRLTGDLTEACTCSVPCTCNFGENPSPYHFCYALWSLDIQSGHYGETNLDGLRLAFAGGAKGLVTYVDERATPEQADTLKKITRAIYNNMIKNSGFKNPKQIPQELRFLGFRRARIVQEMGEKQCRLEIGQAGGFTGNYIMGIDGKTPVIVENNWSWNIQHGIKGKTVRLSYRDGYGNKLDYKDTNMNQGKFDWSDTTPIYLR